MLTDSKWEKLSRLMLFTGRAYSKPEHRNTFEGILYRMRVGCPWRDVPKAFGDWSAVYRRFNLWSKKGVLTDLFVASRQLSDNEWIFIDGSIVKAHQHSTGACTLEHEGIGKSVAATRPKFIWRLIVVDFPSILILLGDKYTTVKQRLS
jgi:transposase